MIKRFSLGLISDKQTAFVRGRQILDGVLIANEVVHWVEQVMKKLVLLKLDFAKGYDCLNWKFMDSVMKQINFRDKWRKWII